MQDAQEIMDVLVKAQASQGEMEPDDPQVTYSMCSLTCKNEADGCVCYISRTKYGLLYNSIH